MFHLPMPDFSREELGSLLRKYIQRSSKTQRQVADEVGIGQPSYVSHMANGRVNWVESEYFPKLAEALSLTVDEVKELRPEVIVIAAPVASSAAAAEYVQVRINIMSSGITESMKPHNPVLTSVSQELARRALGGLVMDRAYVREIPEGFYALWSDRKPEPGELVVVEKGGAQYPAFLLEGGLVEVDMAINPTTPLRFKPDQIIGVVEEIRLLEIPKRHLS